MRKTLSIPLLLFILLMSLGVPTGAQAASGPEMLFNGDFAVRAEENPLPAGWYYDAWIPEDSDYGTETTPQEEQAVVLHNLFENDARICQRVTVEPNTAYRFSCEIYAEGIRGDAGAAISVLDTFSGSDPVYNSGAWKKVSFTGVTASGQKELIVALRIGGYGALSSGKAYFKNVSMERLSSVPAGALSLAPQTAGGAAAGTGDAPNWAGILLTTALCAALFAFLYKREIMRPLEQAAPPVLKAQYIVVILLALLLRVVLSVVFVGHSTDINCFMAWADMMAEYGPGGFYRPEVFADYPPGYMYILWAIGGLRRLLGLNYTSSLFILLLKLPAIAADILSAWFIYRIARKQGMAEQKAFLLFGIVALNPMAAFVSGGWGQIDSILTLLLLFTCWLLTDEKLIAAGAVYGLAILLKPQALMAGPLLAVAYLLPRHGQKYKARLGKTALAVLAAVGVIVLLTLPFTFGRDMTWMTEKYFHAAAPVNTEWHKLIAVLLEKYFSTAAGYPYASVEAFNLFSLIGGNWAPIERVPFLFSYGVWGAIFITLSVIAAALLHIRGRRKGQKGILYLALAFLLAALFTTGPYMHERYLFPAILLLFAAAVYYDDRRLVISALYFSATLLFNAFCAFYIVDYQQARGDFYDALTFIGSLATVLGFLYLCHACWQVSWQGRAKPTGLYAVANEEEERQAATPQAAASLPEVDTQAEPLPALYEKKLRFTKKDRLYCWGLTLLYAIFALTNLGSLKAPETEYASHIPGETVELALPRGQQISEMWVFGGIAQGTMLLTTGEGEELSFEQVYDDMFRWKRVSFPYSTESVSIMTYSGELRIKELAFFDAEGRLLQAVPQGAAAAALCDEQGTVPERPSYFNGMYFDELYHARTAYEHLHGIDPYENSHPPLGKVFIMLGIAVFGMNPFGWRIVGALFGIGMVPLMYAFGKRLFKKPEYALLTAALFAFDFMHFTQTRIATIDVYGVFFIILMYYYMYQYYCMNFYVDGLDATLKPLGLAGLFFGLGAASKWICIYAGAGLAVLLGLSLFRRYKEYRAAMAGEDEAAKQRVQGFSRNVIHTLAWCCAFYIAVPVVIYVLSYMPYYLCEMKYGLGDVWGYQKYMWSYHSTLDATHPFQSTWWEWPFTLRPMWYYMSDSQPEGMISTMTASGNPAVWWVCTAATLVLAALRIQGKVKNEPGITVSFTGVLANFLPWVLVTRCTFIYHFFATVPFIIFCGVYLLRYCEQRDGKLKWVKWAWMGVAVALFLLLYPGISGLPIPLWYARILQYLPGGNLMYGA